MMISSAIPYRSDPAVGAGDILWAGLIALGLLAVAFIVLLQLRRKGWLGAWTNGTPGTKVASRWNVHSQRISRRAVAHTLTRDGYSMLVVETPNGVAMAPLATEGEFQAGGAHGDQDGR